jgi:hypothetical protein
VFHFLRVLLYALCRFTGALPLVEVPQLTLGTQKKN